MAIFWRRFSTAGAVASMLTGTFGTLLLIWLSPTIQIDVLKGTTATFPLKNPALVTIPLSFLVGIVVSLMTSTAETSHDDQHERRLHLGDATTI
jgi:cation/acetate symporter